MEPIRTNESLRTPQWLLAWFGVILILFFLGVGTWLWLTVTAVLDMMGPSFAKTILRGLDEAIQQAMEAMLTVIDFEGNLAVGNIELAYDLTTEDFQRKQNLDEFVKLVEDHPELRWHWKEMRGEDPTADSCIYRVTAEAKDGRLFTFRLRLRKENGKWKVDEIILR